MKSTASKRSWAGWPFLRRKERPVAIAQMVSTTAATAKRDAAKVKGPKLVRLNFRTPDLRENAVGEKLIFLGFGYVWGSQLIAKLEFGSWVFKVGFV